MFNKDNFALSSPDLFHTLLLKENGKATLRALRMQALSICSCGLMSPQCNWTVAARLNRRTAERPVGPVPAVGFLLGRGKRRASKFRQGSIWVHLYVGFEGNPKAKPLRLTMTRRFDSAVGLNPAFLLGCARVVGPANCVRAHVRVKKRAASSAQV